MADAIKQVRRNRFTWLSLVVIALVAFTTYFFSLNSGFLWDDWDFVKFLIRLPFPAYVTQYFDPRVQFMWYRPMSGMLWWVNYQLFGTNSFGYHLVALLLHTANSWLLFALVRRVSGNFRIGLIAALIYTGLPLFSDAILWLADSQPQATLCYLLALWFWLTYLEQESRVSQVLALFFAFLALITKETSITLPVTLLLADRLLVRKPTTWQALFRRYLPLALFVLFHLALMYRALTYGVFPNHIGYKPGAHIIAHALEFLARLILPWSNNPVLDYVALGIGILLWGWAMRAKEYRGQFAFLGLTTLLLILPVSALTESGVKTRYTYTAAGLIAILYALGTETIRRMLARSAAKWILTAILSLVVVWNGWVSGEASQTWAEVSRVERVPFRTIAQRHPQFPEDTYLFFLNRWTGYFSTMFAARYGTGVIVQDIYAERFAGLREHQNSIVIYLDEQNNPIELRVDKDTVTQKIFASPLEFEKSIQLLGYELCSSRIKRGEPLTVILYWRALKKLDKEYSVFVHLVDGEGNRVVGRDSQPRDGTAPTTKWLLNTLVLDGFIIPLDADVPVASNYRLEIGLYDLFTMQRLTLADGTDHIVIEQLQIIP